MRPISISRTLAAADTDSMSLLQTIGAAGNFTITGALASGGVATVPVPAQVTLTSAGNISAVNFTLTGTDYRGLAISEVIAGPNGNTVTSVNTYATVTQVAAGAAVATNTSVGTAQSGSSPVAVLDQYLNPTIVTLALEITGTVNATVQYTEDDVFTTSSLDSLVWISHSDLTAKTANAVGTLISTVRGVRLVMNSGSGTGILKVNQSGAVS